MFAVIFAVKPKPAEWDAYLDYAKLLRPELERVDGFIDNERFTSKRRPGWLLSLSTWRDEKAVIRWRTTPIHHGIQRKGRSQVFEDYHLRVGEIVADSAPAPGQVLREQRFDETERGAAKLVAITEQRLDPPPQDADAARLATRLGGPDATQGTELVDWDLFESITRTGAFALVTSWRTAATVLTPPSEGARQRRIRVIREYGMFDRAEAPQFHPPVDAAPPR